MKPMMTRKSCFPPATDANTRILLLGSLPGEESLRRGQYYGHRQNRFWELVGGVLGIELRALPYEDRLAALLGHHVGLWDVIADATRVGSLDSAIRDAAPNDLAALAQSLPRLRAIGFNGRKAAIEGRKLLADGPAAIALLDLPSSSPAYAAMPFAEKAARWRVIATHIGRADPSPNRPKGR